MKSKSFEYVYKLFRLEFYKNFYGNLKSELDITALDLADCEIIYLLEKPTVSEFAKFVNISLPNASYRVKRLLKVGLITKESLGEDARESYLVVNEKFKLFYSKNGEYGDFIWNKIKERTDKEELATIKKAMKIIERILKWKISLS